MSETNINDYYPTEGTPPSLIAGEAPNAAPEPIQDSTIPVPPTESQAPVEIEDLGIDLPDIPLPDDEPIEDAVKDQFDDAAFNFCYCWSRSRRF